MYEDLYCKVYLDAPGNTDELKKIVAEASRGSLTGRSVTTDVLQIDIFENIANTAHGGMNGFVTWPYYLEIEPIDSAVDGRAYIASLAELVRELKLMCCGVMPSCDFEDQLQA